MQLRKMKWFHPLAHLLIILIGLTVASCGEPEEQPVLPQQTSLSVLTSFYPTTYWAEFLLDGAVPVRCLLPSDKAPSSWRPGREEIEQFNLATLIVLNGADFETWANRSNLAPSRIVDTSESFSEQHLQTKGMAHSHGAGGEHVHSQVDGHTWMDPQLARLQAKALSGAFLKAFPDHTQTLQANAAKLDSKFQLLGEAFQKLSPQLAKLTLYANHSTYDYPARSYGWKGQNLNLNPAAPFYAWPPFGLSETGPCILLWEQQPHDVAAKKLAEDFKVLSVFFDPCKHARKGEDYFERMHANLQRLESALQKLPAFE